MTLYNYPHVPPKKTRKPQRSTQPLKPAALPSAKVSRQAANKTNIGIILGNIGLYRDNGEENGNYREHRVYIGVYIGYR